MDAKQVVTSYHNAWTSGDMAAAHVYLADDLDFQGSIDTFKKADDFIGALTMFQKMLSRVTLIHSFYSDRGAALLYDCETMTRPVWSERRSSLRLRTIRLKPSGWSLMQRSFENLWPGKLPESSRYKVVGVRLAGSEHRTAASIKNMGTVLFILIIRFSNVLV